MLKYEEYMRMYPQVSRNRAEKIMTEEGLFLKENGRNLAVFHENGSSTSMVWVDIDNLRCDCNVFRTKKACPHIAAALAVVEKNGGKVPYTDPVTHVFGCLEDLKKHKHDHLFQYGSSSFYGKVEPFLGQLPEKKKKEFVLDLAHYLQDPDTNLKENDFSNCYDILTEHRRNSKEFNKLLYENRHECLYAVLKVMDRGYSGSFTDEQKKTVVEEIAADDALAVQYLPFLSDDYYDYFSRDQILTFYRTQDPKELTGLENQAVLKRMVTEDPPLYDEFFEFLSKGSEYIVPELELPVIKKMVQNGYAARMGKIFDKLVEKIRKMDDYFKLAKIIPQEQFLAAWKRSDNRRGYGWNSAPHEVRYEINFRLDPDTDIHNYNLEVLNFHLLSVIRQVRPDYAKDVNNAARKIYRKAVKEGHQDKAMEAMMLLAKGDDSIAVKYASEWEIRKEKKDDLVYLAAIGTKFDSLQKLAPELKKLEVTHAAGQN